MTMAEFKDVFAKLRKEKDLSQEEMAKQLEVSKATIGMWETGKRLPRNETYEQIADYFNVDMDYLYGRSDIRKKVHIDENGNEYLNADSDLTIIQRERSKMSEKQKSKLMNILKANFDDFNWGIDESGDIE